MALVKFSIFMLNRLAIVDGIEPDHIQGKMERVIISEKKMSLRVYLFRSVQELIPLFQHNCSMIL